jgi:putative cell wall-binding protein
MTLAHAVKPAQKLRGGNRGSLKKVLAVGTTAALSLGLSLVGATSASAAVGVITAVASCQPGGDAQVVMTYSNPDSYSMYANGGFGEPTVDWGFSNDTISEGPMAGQQWGLFYEGTDTSDYDGGGFNLTSGTASKTFTVPHGTNGGTINFGYFVKAGAEQNSYIPRQDIQVNTDCPAPTTVNVDDSQILPIEDVTGWGDGYAHSPRSYFTAADGAHIGNGHATQLINTFSPWMPTSDLESLITGSGIDVVSGSATFQIAMRYGSDNPQDFTTLRSLSLTTTGNTFSASDMWVSTKDIVDSGNAVVIHKNTQTTVADLVAALNAQGTVKVQGVGVQADSAAVVQDLIFNGTKFHFVPSSASAATNHVVVADADIDTYEAGDGSNYTNWHEGYTNASKSFKVNAGALSLGNPHHSQILKGLTTPVAGSDLYGVLTSQADVTVDSGTVTYQVAFTHAGAIGWGTLRSASLATGDHTFSLTDSWMSSQAIGGSISANTAYPLGDILDALNAEGSAFGTAFGVQADSAAQVSSVRFGDTEYTFANPAGTTCDAPDFPATGKYEVHLGRGLEERNQAAVFNINSFGGLVDADDPSDTLAEIQGYGAGWTNTYIRTMDEPGEGNDFSNGYVITYTFLHKIVTGTVTVGPNGCNSLVWNYTNIIESDRLAGQNRYETAVAISQQWADDFGGRVYIANGLGYPDALSAGPAAAYNNSPLLLTAPDALPAEVVTELNRLEPTEIVIVGGTGVVSEAVETALSNLSFHPTVTREAGANRYETSRKIAEDTFTAGTVSTVYLANGTNFPDALSASPAAAAFGGAVILVNGASASVDAATLALLTTLGVTDVKIAGGTGSISAGIEAQMVDIYGADHVVRNGGADRYATSILINADQFTTAPVVYLAQGAGFPDALAGAALAGNEGAPLFVSSSNCISQGLLDALTSLGTERLVLLGGTGVLSTAVEDLTVCS